MSGKWPGGFIKKTVPTVVGPVDGEGGSASGIWTLDQVADYEQRGLWPMPILDKELYSWGNGSSGQLGQGNTTSYSSPVQVGALVTWSEVKGAMYGIYALATKTDGTLWAWGAGDNGQLGLGDLLPRSSPVQIGALTTWYKMAGGYTAAAAIKTDGTLWSWGYNNYGQLGLNNTTNYQSPVQVGALTNWSGIVMGANYCIATKTDGTLWSWGQNNHGQLGLGDTSNRSSPVQVGALTTWLQAAAGYFHTLAVKTDGTLWSWGNGGFGRLGQGSTTSYSSPVQIGALTTWLNVSAGLYSGYAVKTDGALWAWGYNGQGAIGQGSFGGTRNSPVQVGALTDWLQAAAGYQCCIATKTDGTLWSWGANNHGQLGLGDTTARNAPVQVGALTTWKKDSVSFSRDSGYSILKT